jgi:hypothetical protein
VATIFVRLTDHLLFVEHKPVADFLAGAGACETFRTSKLF